MLCLSMLPSCQHLQLEKVKVQEEIINTQVEKERMKVREARWEYFQATFDRDHSQLKQLASALKKLEALKHRKQVAWRMNQETQGEKVVKSFMEKSVRCDLVEKVGHTQQKVNEFVCMDGWMQVMYVRVCMCVCKRSSNV